MKTWTRAVIAVIIFCAVAAGSTMISVYLFHEAKQARIAEENSDEIKVDSVYDDRIKSGLDPNYDRSPYRALAKELESDPIHVDDYLAFDIDDAGLAAIRREIKGLDSPIYVAFINHTMLDDTDASMELKAARIAHELDVDEASVLVISTFAEGVGSQGIERELRELPKSDPDDTLTSTGLRWVQALKNSDPHEVSRADDLVAEDHSSDSRALRYSSLSAVSGAGFGLVVGAAIAVVGVACLGYVRRQRESGNPAGSRRSVNHRNRRK